MAHTTLTDCYISLDGTVVSNLGASVSISMSAEVLDISSFGTETKTHFGGTKDFAIELEFIQDESVIGTDFFAMVGEVVPFEIRPTSAAISTTNPAYKGHALCTQYTPLSGGHGEVSRVTMSFIAGADPVSGESDLSRTTTP